MERSSVTRVGWLIGWLVVPIVGGCHDTSQYVTHLQDQAVVDSGSNDTQIDNAPDTAPRDDAAGDTAADTADTISPPPSWTATPCPSQLTEVPDLRAVWGLDDHVWIGGYGETIFRLSASTPSDIKLTTKGFDNGSVRDIWGLSETQIWAVHAGRKSNVGDLLKYDQEGAWERVKAVGHDLRALWGFTGPTRLFAAGDSGLLIDSADAYKAYISGPVTDFKALWGSSPSTLWVVGTKSKIAYFDGSTWDAPHAIPGATGAFYGIWGVTDGLWVVGALGQVAEKKLSGKWTVTHHGTTKHNDIWGDATARVWIVGDGGSIWHYDGTQWIAQRAYATDQKDLHAIWGTSKTIWAVGDACTILRRDLL